MRHLVRVAISCSNLAKLQFVVSCWRRTRCCLFAAVYEVVLPQLSTPHSIYGPLLEHYIRSYSFTYVCVCACVCVVAKLAFFARAIIYLGSASNLAI